MPGLFLRRGRADGPDVEVTRVEFRGETLDDPALARCVPAFEQDDAALAVCDMRRLDTLQPCLQGGDILVEVALVFGTRFMLVKVNGHAANLGESARPARADYG